MEYLRDGRCGCVHLTYTQGEKGVNQAQQKKSLLLHSAGMNVQDIFFTLPEGEGENIYAKTVNALTTYFSPQSNVGLPYERHMFRSMEQLDYRKDPNYPNLGTGRGG